ncbi:ComEA family DNA-binding protein [Aquirufa sp. HETE-40SA]
MKTILFLLASFVCFAQISTQEEEEKQSSYDYYLANPLNINLVSEAELQSSLLFSAKQIEAFLSFRKNLGSFQSILELQSIPGWELDFLRKIQDYVVCNPLNPSWWKPRLSTHQILFKTDWTAETKKGFTDPDLRSKTRYIGDRTNQMLRYRGQLNANLRIGFLVQKDAGEKELTDFSSGFLEFKSTGTVEKIILGDFINQWGQGLVQSGGFSLGKSFESIKATQKFNLGGLAYSSSVEYGYYRGINTTLKLTEFIRIQAFVSYRNLDATTGVDSLGNKYLRSRVEDGFHRTSSEISHKDAVQEKAEGANITYSPLNIPLVIQFNSVFTSWSLPKPIGTGYKQPEWSGNELQNYSISFQYPFRNIRMVGEFATSGNRQYSLIQSAATSLSKKIDLSYLFRHYGAGYFSPKSNGLSENAENINEMGLFLGLGYQINKRMKLSSYVDYFRFPGPKYQVLDSNTSGWEVLSRLQWEKRHNARGFLQGKWTRKENNDLVQISLDGHYIAIKSWDFHSRLMASTLGDEMGYLLLQDVKWDQGKWNVQGRFAYMNTPTYDTRNYAYEPGVPYSFLLPAYAGKAIKTTLVMSYQWTREIGVAAKWGRIQYQDRMEVGSGLDLIEGNTKTDITLQISYKMH